MKLISIRQFVIFLFVLNVNVRSNLEIGPVYVLARGTGIFKEPSESRYSKWIEKNDVPLNPRMSGYEENDISSVTMKKPRSLESADNLDAIIVGVLIMVAAIVCIVLLLVLLLALQGCIRLCRSRGHGATVHNNPLEKDSHYDEVSVTDDDDAVEFYTSVNDSSQQQIPLKTKYRYPCPGARSYSRPREAMGDGF